MSPESFRAYVRDAISSLAEQAIHKIVAVNGHEGNIPSLLEIARELRQRRIAIA